MHHTRRDVMPFIDLTGRTVGKWSVLGRTPQKKTVRYYCRCECGTEREVLSASLRTGKSLCCGACGPNPDVLARKYRTTWNSYVGMRQRCRYPGHAQYGDYGGRGICCLWETFSEFLADMGPRPPGTSLDRLDNDGPYCKENCRWATRAEQMLNRRTTVLVQWQGESIPLKTLAQRLGVNYDRLHKWHRTNGLPIQQAVVRAGGRGADSTPYVPNGLSADSPEPT